MRRHDGGRRIIVLRGGQLVFVDGDGLGDGTGDLVALAVQRHEGEAAALVADGVPRKLGKIGRVDGVTGVQGGGDGAALAIGIDLQGRGLGRAVLVHLQCRDPDLRGGLVFRVTREQGRVQRHDRIVCRVQGLAAGRIIRRKGRFVDGDGAPDHLVVGAQQRHIGTVQRHEGELAAGVVAGVPDQIVDGGLAQHHRHGGQRMQRAIRVAEHQAAGVIGLGIVDADLRDGHEAGGTGGVVAVEQRACQGVRQVLLHVEGEPGAVVDGRQRRFTHGDGLLAKAHDGLLLPVQRDEAEGAAFVVGTVPAQVGKIVGTDGLPGPHGFSGRGGRRDQAEGAGGPLVGVGWVDGHDLHEGRFAGGITAGQHAGIDGQCLVVGHQQRGVVVVHRAFGRFVHRHGLADGLAAGIDDGHAVAVQGREAELATVVVTGIPAHQRKIGAIDDAAGLQGLLRAVAVDVEGRPAGVGIALRADAVDAHLGRTVFRGGAAQNLRLHAGDAVMRHRDGAVGRIGGRNGRFVHLHDLRRQVGQGILVGIQRDELEAATAVVAGIPADLAELGGRHDVTHLQRGEPAVFALQHGGRASAVLDGGIDGRDLDEGRTAGRVVAGKDGGGQGQHGVLRHDMGGRRLRIIRIVGILAYRDGLGRPAGYVGPLRIHRHEAEAAAFGVHGVPADLVEVLGADGVARLQEHPVPRILDVQGRKAVGLVGVFGEGQDAHGRRATGGVLAGEQGAIDRVLCVVAGLEAQIVRIDGGEGGFVDGDGLRGAGCLTAGVQGREAETAAVIVGAVPDETAEVGRCHHGAGGHGGQCPVFCLQVQGGRAAVGLAGIDAVDAHATGRGRFRVLAGQGLGVDGQCLVVGDGVADGLFRIYGYRGQLLHGHDLRCGTADWHAPRIAGNELEFAAGVVFGAPEHAAEIGFGDDGAGCQAGGGGAVVVTQPQAAGGVVGTGIRAAVGAAAAHAYALQHDVVDGFARYAPAEQGGVERVFAVVCHGLDRGLHGGLQRFGAGGLVAAGRLPAAAMAVVAAGHGGNAAQQHGRAGGQGGSGEGAQGAGAGCCGARGCRSGHCIACGHATGRNTARGHAACSGAGRCGSPGCCATRCGNTCSRGAGCFPGRGAGGFGGSACRIHAAMVRQQNGAAVVRIVIVPGAWLVFVPVLAGPVVVIVVVTPSARHLGRIGRRRQQAGLRGQRVWPVSLGGDGGQVFGRERSGRDSVLRRHGKKGQRSP